MSNNTSNRVDPTVVTNILLAMIFGALMWMISVLNDVDDSLEMTEFNTTQMRESLKVIETNVARIP